MLKLHARRATCVEFHPTHVSVLRSARLGGINKRPSLAVMALRLHWAKS